MADPSGAPGSFFYVLEDSARILFVDDDPIMREFAGVHLASDKASVEVAADGIEALEQLETGEFDIVLLDLEMPRMDGFEALAHIRSNPRTARLPVIVVTGREDVFAIDRAFQAGATSFLVKPINWRLLSYQVRYVQRNHAVEMHAGQGAGRANAALKKLATEAAGLLRTAMAGSPEMRSMAADYVTLLEKTAAEMDEG